MELSRLHRTCLASPGTAEAEVAALHHLFIPHSQAEPVKSIATAQHYTLQGSETLYMGGCHLLFNKFQSVAYSILLY